jgi:hypothetical protein
MPDDQYDELIKRKQSEREEQYDEAERERSAQQRIDQVAFHRRNALYAALTRRADELQNRYPELGQLFARTYGDRFDLIKSKHPSGRFTMHFDASQRLVAGDFSNSGVFVEYECAPPSMPTQWSFGLAGKRIRTTRLFRRYSTSSCKTSRSRRCDARVNPMVNRLNRSVPNHH